MVAPLLVDESRATDPSNALLIGLAGGTVARQLTAAFGPIPITGVEIDPDIAAVGRQYFGLADLPNVDVVLADGRYALKTLDQSFDLIGVDAYRQPYIPFQLTSREFFQEVSDHLSPDGVAVVNAGRTATDYRLVDALAATMRAVFPYVMAIDVAQYNNTILVGSNAPYPPPRSPPGRSNCRRLRLCARWRPGAPAPVACVPSPLTQPRSSLQTTRPR